MTIAWLTFAASAAVVIVAGLRIARDGDALARASGLGGMWIGAILVAATTSLPELATDLSAVLQGRPSLAVGDLFGSSMANMLILAVADLSVRKTRVLTRVAITQAAVGALAVLLTGIATLGILAGGGGPLGIGWSVLAVTAGYLVGMRVLRENRPEPPFRAASDPSLARPPDVDVRRSLGGFAAAGVAILLAAPFLAGSAATLADGFGISHGFAGMVLLALTTSMPEVVVSLAAVRAGSYDLAVGNLLGSNCFNMLVLLPLDLANGGTPILAEVGPELAVGAVASMVLTALALLDVLDRAERRRGWFEPGPALMIVAYVASLWLVARVHG